MRRTMFFLAACAALVFGCGGTSTSGENDGGPPDSGADGAADTDAGDDGGATHRCSGYDVFPDPKLDEAMRKIVGWQVTHEDSYTGAFTPEILAQVVIIGGEAYQQGITSIEGFQCLANVEEVLLAENRIADLGPMAGLKKIKNLRLEGNRIEDISALSGVSSLYQVWLSRNRIADLAPLGGLPLLHAVVADDNLVEEAAPIASLPALAALSLSRNPLSDVAEIGKAEGLGTLALAGCGISTLEWISGLASIHTLDLAYNEIEDAGELSNLTLLYRLYLEGNRIEDLSFAKGLDALVDIAFAENRVADLSPLRDLPALEKMCREIDEASGCLDDIDLHGNRIADLSPLRDFIAAFSEKTGKPASIDLSDNLLTDLSALAGTRLWWFDVTNNDIRDPSALVDVSVSEGFELVDNRVESLSFLELMAETGAVDHAEYLLVLGNPLDGQALEEEVPGLCASEVPLYWGDGEHCDFIEYPIELPEWDTDPEPAAGPDEQPESCGVDRMWLADGALPGAAHHGAVFAPSAPVAGEAVVTDAVTGLVWRRCSAGQAWDGATCTGEVAQSGQAAARTACEAGYAGFDDWRVPDATELLSLVDYSEAWPGPVLDAAAFPETYPGRYWSSPVLAEGSAVAWQVNFYNGELEASREDAAVRCVRGGRAADVGTRYQAGSDGTVLDTWSGLTWRSCAEGQNAGADGCAGQGTRQNEAGADTACDGAFGGYDDWRLPNVDELASLVSYCAHDAAMSRAAFPDAPRGAFWTATPLAGDTKRWLVDMSWGGIPFAEPSGVEARVRCVRGP